MPAHFHMDQSLRPGTGAGAGGHGAGKPAYSAVLQSLWEVRFSPQFRALSNIQPTFTKLALDAGYVPMLYTDADYVASNACYEKIGYVLQGKLCTIG